MATVYDTNAYNDAPANDLRSGVNYQRVKYTVGSTAIDQASGDYIRVCKLPKGVEIYQELCAVYSDSDPDGDDNLTVSLKVTDGTTTKTIISTSNFQAADTRIVASAADITGLGLFKTSNDDFYVKFTPEAGDIDASSVLFFVIAYSTDASRDCSTT